MSGINFYSSEFIDVNAPSVFVNQKIKKYIPKPFTFKKPNVVETRSDPFAQSYSSYPLLTTLNDKNILLNYRNFECLKFRDIQP